MSQDSQTATLDQPAEPAAAPTLVFKVGTRLEDIERAAIYHTLQAVQGDRAQAATILGVSQRTIDRRLHAYENLPDPCPCPLCETEGRDQ